MSKGTMFQSSVSKLLLDHHILAAHNTVHYDHSKSQEEVKKRFTESNWDNSALQMQQSIEILDNNDLFIPVI